MQLDLIIRIQVVLHLGISWLTYLFSALDWLKIKTVQK